MTSTEIQSLEEAYKFSPDNTVLLNLLLNALIKHEKAEDAFNYIESAHQSFFDTAENRALAGQISLSCNKPEDTVKYCTEDSAEELLLLSQAHHQIGNIDKSRSLYRLAIEKNATLEDPALEKLLNTREENVTHEDGSGNVVGFKVITNDAQLATSRGEDDDTMGFVTSQSDVTFKDVGGLDHVKKQIHRKIILPFQKPSLFQKFKKKAGGGVLLYGPPGCGKTLLARATAGECNARFYNIAISDILDMYIGESERKLHAIFEQARRSGPSVLFFDELEALAGKRQYNADSASAKLVSQFLSEMDGFASDNQGVLILGATNVPWSIDSAFRRPGRFDRIQFIPPPDRTARKVILNILSAERPMERGVDLAQLAKLTSGFSGADLSNLVESACDEAIERTIETGKETPITHQDLLETLDIVKATTAEWLTTARNYARYSNESGQYDEILDFLKKHGK